MSLNAVVDWSSVGCICFDVDSTVCTNEALDDLSDFLGCSEEIKNITKRAMDGELDFTESFTVRLNIMKPTQGDIQRFLSQKPLSLTNGVEILVNRLRVNGIHVCLVTGGLFPIVHRLASSLRIPDENLFANKLLFAENGSYLGFDSSLPTCRSDGKAVVVGLLEKRYKTKIIMVGDGMTDARACPPAIAFIGYGEHVDRPAVRATTPFYCTSMDELTNFFEQCSLLSR